MAKAKKLVERAKAGSGIVEHAWADLAQAAADEAAAWAFAKSGRIFTEDEHAAARAGAGAFLHKLLERKVVAISDRGEV